MRLHFHVTKSFLSHSQLLNRPQHSGRFNFTTQFPYYRKVLYKPDFSARRLGKPVVFDMDMSAGDFLSLFYLLKVPVEEINLTVKNVLLSKLIQNVLQCCESFNFLFLLQM